MKIGLIKAFKLNIDEELKEEILKGYIELKKLTTCNTNSDYILFQESLKSEIVTIFNERTEIYSAV